MTISLPQLWFIFELSVLTFSRCKDPPVEAFLKFIFDCQREPPIVENLSLVREKKEPLSAADLLRETSEARLHVSSSLGALALRFIEEHAEAGRVGRCKVSNDDWGTILVTGLSEVNAVS